MVNFVFLVVGAILAFFGFGAAANAYEVARKGEQHDAVGSQRSFLDAEPADWNVMVTRVAWLLVGVVGLGMVAFGVLG